MNSEFAKSAMTRIVLVGVLAGAANYVLVRPKLTQASDIVHEQRNREVFLKQGEQVLYTENDQLKSRVVETAHTRDKVLEDLENSKGNQDQQQFQRLAGARGLTITRVEPIRSSSVKQFVGEGLVEAQAVKKEYRIECRGAFSGFVSLMSDMQSSNRRLSVTDFRLVPAGEDEVRVSMTVAMLELTEYPPLLKTMLSQESDQDSSLETQGDS